MKLTPFRKGPLLCGHGAVSPCLRENAHRAQSPATQRRDHIRKGFTLVEVLASLLFLAIAVPAIVGALGIASRTSEVAERSSIAGGLAENKLNEMLVDNAWQSAAQSNGDFGADFPSCHWRMSTQTWAGGVNTPGMGTTTASNVTTGANSLTELSIEVFYPVQGSEHSVRLTTLVNLSSTATGSTNTTSGTSTTK